MHCLARFYDKSFWSASVYDITPVWAALPHTAVNPKCYPPEFTPMRVNSNIMNYYINMMIRYVTYEPDGPRVVCLSEH